MKKKLNLLVNYLEKKLSRKRSSTMPWKFFIEVALSCNLQCITCVHGKQAIKGIMPDLVFDRIKPYLDYARVVHEVGYGEPFLNKTFIQKLTYLKGKSAYVDVTTNGTLLDRDTSYKLIDAGLDQITFSLDGATPETFESIRKGAEFSRVLRNIEALSEIKKLRNTKTPFMRINFVGMKRNMAELPDIIKLAARLGVGEVVLSDLFPPDYQLGRECLFFHPELAENSITDAKRAAKESGINLITPSSFKKPEFSYEQTAVTGEDKEDTKEQNVDQVTEGFSDSNECAHTGFFSPGKIRKKISPCYEPWQTLYVTCEGKVKPCCAMVETFGDINRQRLEDIWNSEKYRLLRKTVNTESPAFEACRTCLFRNRVRFSLKEGFGLLKNVLVNEGPVRTLKKSAKYVVEYF
jgi:radical SAM protein with 4Fe4S-binding SPASM domain